MRDPSYQIAHSKRQVLKVNPALKAALTENKNNQHSSSIEAEKIAPPNQGTGEFP
jgi:hypothetical protein